MQTISSLFFVKIGAKNNFTQSFISGQNKIISHNGHLQSEIQLHLGKCHELIQVSTII